MKRMLQLFFVLLCFLNKMDAAGQNNSQANKGPVIVTDLELLDSSRSRKIPVLLYSKTDLSSLRSTNIIIFSPGFGIGVDYKSYTYLAEYLANKGYLVVSIQHQLRDDLSGATRDEFTVTRSPNWETGVENIQYVLKQIPIMYPGLKAKSLTLIGHSNGGDISMLYASKYPSKLKKVISLDNRRIPIPLLKRPTICSIRSSEEKPHEDLLPSPQAINKYKMRIIYLKDVKHNDMDQSGSPEKHQKILKALDACMASRWKSSSSKASNLVPDDL